MIKITITITNQKSPLSKCHWGVALNLTRSSEKFVFWD